MTTPHTVVNLDLYKLCKERVGLESFLIDLPDDLNFVSEYYIPFGVGTFVDIIIGTQRFSGRIKVKTQTDVYEITFIDKDNKQYSESWVLNPDNTANGKSILSTSTTYKGTWKLSDSLYDLEKKKTEAQQKVDTANADVAEAQQKVVTANAEVAEAQQKKDAVAVAMAETIPAISAKANKQAENILKSSNENLQKANTVLTAAKTSLTRANDELESIKTDISEYNALNRISIGASTSTINSSTLTAIFNKFKSNNSIIFYGLFRILMACDAIHDFLGSRGFNNCEVFGAGVTTAGDIKIEFRNGIVDAVIDSFISLFSDTNMLEFFKGIGSSVAGTSSASVPTPLTPETLANALLDACLQIIPRNDSADQPRSKKAKSSTGSLREKLIHMLDSDANAKKLSEKIISAIGLKKVSGNIQRNSYKTGFTTIVDTHEAIDSYYTPSKPKYWEGDIECRVDAIGSPNHFIPILIGLWNSANITTANDLQMLDPNHIINTTMLSWATNQSVGNYDINRIRDVYSTFRKISIERDISTNFDASFVDSLTKTGSCLRNNPNCNKEYDTIKFNITCDITLVSASLVIQVPILNCSLTAEPEVMFNSRPDFYKDSVTKKNIPKKRKITLNVTNYFGAIPTGDGNYVNINDIQQLMGVNKIALEMCKNQTTIVQQSWAKTLGDFLQIMTYLGIPKSQAKMFVTFDIIAGNIASLFDKFVFLENVGKKRFVADVEDEPEPEDEDDPMNGQYAVAQAGSSSTTGINLVKLFELAYGGTYIYIPKSLKDPPQTTNVNIMSRAQFELSTRFGSRNKSNFGKKIKAAIIQARAYLKKYPFRKKTINMLQVNELRTKLNSVGIKTYVLKSGKKVNLSLRQLQSAANYFKKLQISCKNAGIKLMYNRNGKYYYKSYSRLVNESRKSGKSGKSSKSSKSSKSNKINAMDVNELRTRLNSVGIKTYVLKSGKKVNLPLIQLQRAANYFKKLQIRCKNAGIKLMYKRNGKYYYKSYTRLMSETKRNKFG